MTSENSTDQILVLEEPRQLFSPVLWTYFEHDCSQKHIKPNSEPVMLPIRFRLEREPYAFLELLGFT